MTQKLLQKWSEATPEAMFAVFESGSSWTYAQALEKSREIGRGLIRLGVKPGNAVLSFLPNGEEAIALFIGANAAGAIFAPLNTAYRDTFLEHAINVPRASVLIAHASLVDRLAGLSLPYLRTVIVVGKSDFEDSERTVLDWDALLNAPSVDLPPLPASTDDMVYIYTSGTTGPSKAVRCSYAHHEAYAKWFGHGDIGAADRAYVCLPMFHVGGTGWLYTMLYRGGSIAVVERFVTKNYWQSVRRLGATTGTIMAAMASFLMREPPSPDDADNPMRIALLVPNIPEADEFARRFGITLWSGFAMSEVPGPLRTRLGATNLRTAGQPISNEWRVRLIDKEGKDVPANTVGELLVQHATPGVITEGYVNMPEASKQVWRDGWFNTGDLFRRDNHGDFYFVDRNKDALRRRGENISSLEVEAVIATHPDVIESAIVGVPAAEMEDEVMAFVVRQSGELRAEELFEYLANKLPHFMMPRYIEFIESLPRTPTEKVVKTGLRQQGIGPNTWDSLAAGYIVKASGITKKTVAATSETRAEDFRHTARQ